MTLRNYLFLFLPFSFLVCQGQDRIRAYRTTIHGKVIELKEGNVLFLTNAGDTVHFGYDDFQVILRQTNTLNRDKGEFVKMATSKRQPISQDRRLFGQLDMGMTIRNTPETVIKPSLTGAILYKPLSWVYAGVGGGYDHFDDVNLFPVFGRISANLSQQSVSPYLEMNVGYSFAKMKEESPFDTGFEPSAEGGVRFHPRFGFKIVDKVSTIFTIGVIYQKMTKETGFIDWMGNPNITREKLSLNMMTFSLGFVF